MTTSLPYPGYLLSDELGIRLLKCYIFKFAKNNIKRKSLFDIKTKKPTDKKIFWFNTLRPLFGPHHVKSNMTSLNELLRLGFLNSRGQVFFLPQYFLDQYPKSRNSYVFSCAGEEAARYLMNWKLGDLQNITIFDSSFEWFVDVYEDLTPDPKSNLDVVVYLYDRGKCE